MTFVDLRRRIAALLAPDLVAAHERARLAELERDQMAMELDASTEAHRGTIRELAATMRDLEMTRDTLRRAAQDQGEVHE